MRHALAFLLLLAATITVQAQFRLASDGFVSVQSNLNDSTYVIDVTLLGDLTGSGYSPTNIQVGYYLFSQREQVYRISATSNLTFGGGTLTIIEQDVNGVNTEGSPIGQVMVYDPPASGKIPQVPFGSTGATSALQAAVVSYNSRVIGSTGSGITEAQARSIASDSVSVERTARQQADNAEAAARAQMVQDSATAIRSDFPAPGLEDAQVRAITSDSVGLERSARIAADQAEANARQQAILDTAAAVRADFPVDTKLTEGEVQAFEADAAAISALADSTNAVRQDFPVPGISAAEARQITSDTATANRAYTDQEVQDIYLASVIDDNTNSTIDQGYTDTREAAIRSTLSDSTAAVRADFPSTANLVTNTDLAISEANSLADAQAYTNSVVADSTAGLRTEVPGLAPVQTVNGQDGTVSLNTDNITEGANLYYTEARVSANTNVATNTAKRTYPIEDENKLAGIPDNVASTDQVQAVSSDLRNTVTLRSVQKNAESGTGLSIVLIGDSNTNATDRFYGPLRDYIHQKFGVGGVGYFSFNDDRNDPSGITVAFTGTVTEFSGNDGEADKSPDMAYVEMGAGSTLTARNPTNNSVNSKREYHYTRAQVLYDNSKTGSFQISIDGSVIATINSGGGASLQTYTSGTLSDQWHDLTLTQVSGSPKIYGAVMSSPDKAVVHKVGANGMSWKSYYNNQDFTHWVSTIAVLEPDHIIFNLGSNDLPNYDSAATGLAAKAIIDSLKQVFSSANFTIISPSERFVSDGQGGLERNAQTTADIKNLRDSLTQFAGLYTTNLIDLYSQWIDRKEDLSDGFFVDEVHYNGPTAGPAHRKLFGYLFPDRSNGVTSTTVRDRINFVNSRNTVNIGANSGVESKAEFGVNIGVFAGTQNTRDNSVNIGFRAGELANGTVNIGAEAGRAGNVSGISIGNLAGELATGNGTVSIGSTAGRFSACNNSVFVGTNSGTNSGGIIDVTGVGYSALNNATGRDITAIGAYSGANSTASRGLFAGIRAGEFSSSTDGVLLGKFTGRYSSGNKMVLIGANLLSNSGDQSTSRAIAIAIGPDIPSEEIAANKATIGNLSLTRFQTGDVEFDVTNQPTEGQIFVADANGLMVLADASATGDNLGNHTMTQTLNTQGFPIANMVDALNNDEAVPLGQLNRKITEAFQYQGNAIYRDTLHDAANAILIPGNGDWINIDLTVSSLDTLDKPTFASGIDLWNEADSTVVALHDRGSGWVRIDCSLDPAGNITSDPAIVVALDIGGTIGKISPTTIKLVNASRQNYTLFIPIYTRGTFVANGAKISVKALGGSDIEFMNQIDAETSAEQSVNIVINYDR